MDDIDTKLLEAIMPRFARPRLWKANNVGKSARRRISPLIGTSRKKRLTIEQEELLYSPNVLQEQSHSNGADHERRRDPQQPSRVSLRALGGRRAGRLHSVRLRPW